MKPKKILALIVTLLTQVPAQAHEVQNGGGSVLVGGKKYEIADLHFRPANGERFVFTEEMTETLSKIGQALNDGLASPLIDSRGREFFASQIFNSDVEFRVVASLPEACRSSELSAQIPSERNGETLTYTSIACTSGSTTWIDPEEFSKLSLLHQAFLLIHERLHAFAPFEPYEIKTDFIKTLMYFYESMLPQILKAQASIRQRGVADDWIYLTEYEDEMLAALNRLSRRRRQLCEIFKGEPRDVEVTFHKYGGILISGDRPTSSLSNYTRIFIAPAYIGAVTVARAQ